MRRQVITLLTAAVFSVGISQIASAADLPTKAPIVKAPVVAAFSWAGWYVGLNAGYAWGRSTETDVTGYNLAGSTISYNANGFQGGAHGGFNWQTNQFVYGIEAEVGYLGLKGSQQYGPFIGVRSAADSVASTSDGAFALLAARIGVASDNWLWFLKGGGLITGIKNSFTDTDPAGTTLVSGTSTSNRNGWTVGAGVEYAFNPNWAGRLEYAHYDFGNAGHTATSSGGGLFNFNHSLRADSVRVGITYLVR